MYCRNIVFRRNPLLNEIELAQLGEFFQKHGLSLYHGVPASDLAPIDGNAAPPLQGGWVTFLVCRGDAALLAVYLPRESWNRGGAPDKFPGLLTLELTDCGHTQIRAAIGQVLENLLRKESNPRWRFLGRPIPPERLPELARAQLAERAFASGCGRLQWCPTEYGIDCGLVQGYGFRSGQGFQAGIWCSEQSRVYLEKLLAQGSAGTSANAVSLSERLARLDRGLCGSAVEAVRRFAHTPLDVYMKDFPAELARLRKALPALRADDAYQDAAALIYWLLEDYELRPEEVRKSTASAPPGLGAELMNVLALPVLARMRPRCG